MTRSEDPAPLKNLWHRHLVSRLLGSAGPGGATRDAAGYRAVVEQPGRTLLLRRYGPDGDALDAAPITVAGELRTPVIAALAVGRSGHLVVAWADDGQRIVARRFDPCGTALDEPFAVHSSAEPAARRNPVVAVNAAGACVILWEHGPTHLRARLFGPQGQPFGPEVDICLALRASAAAQA